MLTKVIIKNVGSIGDTTVIDFSKGKYTYKDNMLTKNDNYVNPIGIFGANGSGKTVLLKAIYKISSFMVDESSDLGFIIPNINQDGINKPSSVELHFKIDDILYCYLICTGEIQNKELGIVEESLIFNDIRLIRKDNSYSVIKENEKVIEGKIDGKYYPVLRKIGIEQYEDNSILSQIKNAYEYLSEITYIDVRGDVNGRITNKKSIKSIMVENYLNVNKVLSSYREFPVYDLKFDVNDDGTKSDKLMFRLNGTDTYIPEFLMSNGMRSHTKMLSTILSMKKGSLLLIDELERSLHPFVAKQFAQELNKNFDIQIIFSSHNTTLLQALRPDQIFFSKWDKERNQSYYNKLMDIYPNIRQVNNIEKMYFGGLLDD